MNNKAGIVGAGFAGLSLAWELVQKGWSVVVWEKEKRAGGLAGSFKVPGWQWEAEYFYHHFFTSDKKAQNLLRDLGINKQLVFVPAKTSIWWQGRIYRFDSPKAILSFERLSWWERLRLGLGVAILKATPHLSWMDRYSASQVLPYLVGKGGFEMIWQPLLKKKFGPFWEEIALAWFWARIKARTQHLGYFEGGFGRLAEIIVEKIQSKGGKVFFSAEVVAIEQKGREWWVQLSNNQAFQVKALVLTTPLPVATKLLVGVLPNQKLEYWRQLKTLGAATLLLRLKKPFLPEGTYWLSILEEQFPFVAVVEHTNFVPSHWYNNEHLVYVGGYYPEGSRVLSSNAEAVLRYFAPFLRRLQPGFERNLIDCHFFASPFAQPVITTNYGAKKPPFALDREGLFWLTTHHIFPWDRGVNFAIGEAQRLAKIIAASF